MLQSTYLPQTNQLLQNPAATTALYSTALLTGYINTARGQLAGEGKCIRAIATLTTVPGQQVYPFSSLNTGVPAVTGIQGVININNVWAAVGNGLIALFPNEWEWFSLYMLNNVIPNQALPTDWTQYGQGSAPPGSPSGASFGGSLYLNPVPDQIYTISCDCTCYPIPLVLDTDVEAIPYLWTDAVPFFAAYYALLSAQTSMRTRDAKEMLQSYEMFMARARLSANPLQLGAIYQGAPDMYKAGRMGAGAPQAAQGGVG